LFVGGHGKILGREDTMAFQTISCKWLIVLGI
jgi:hypothetical protein